MYERFYNLRERPFALSPDPEYLYLSRVHREALDHLRYGVESRAGFTIITGEIGAGKTTLLQSLLQRVDERTVVARIVNTTLEPRELLETILIDFGLETAGKSKPALLRDLGQFLVQLRTQGRRPLLVVDEAQNLTPASLEEVRLLSNLETEKSKLLQILLVGQPNLRDTIASPELEQFRQRVAVSYHLTALDAPDTAAYINYRLEHAAIGEPMRFPIDAAELVHGLSGGVPRIINVICDAALVYGYAEERRNIDRALVQEVVRELESTGVLRQNLPAGHVPAAARRDGLALVAGPSLVAQTGEKSAVSAPPVATEGAEALRPDREREIAQATQLLAAREAELLHQREMMVKRQQDLSAREEAVAQRERQIAEQRRIMNEEYRLLRQRQTPPATAGGAQAGRKPAQSSGLGLGGAQRVPGMLPAHGRADEARHNALWQRIMRLFAREPALRS
jgi:putative secretion ATPase (PEP-CTERM system associated)